MTVINELKLSKDLIRYPSVTPKDAGVIKFLSKNQYYNLTKREIYTQTLLKF